MREAIERILNGQYAEEDRALQVSCSSLEMTLKKGENERGFFVISGADENAVEGNIYTSDPRMELSAEGFHGKEVRIDYLFHGENMAEGEEVKGNIFLISQRGEWSIPFHVTVAASSLESSIGPVKNLFHFANLAKTNWTEALKLFYSPSFKQVFHANDKKYEDDYRNLSRITMHQQNMEEFLIHINKKQKVEYHAQPESLEQEILFVNSYEDLIEREISVIRNGWGYTYLEVEAQGEFLMLTKTVLTEDDFIGNSGRLPVFIDPGACGQGKNQGKLILSNSFVRMEIPVVVTVGERDDVSETRIEQKRGEARIFELYQDFRLKKINLATWLKETNKIIDKMIALDGQDIRFRMYKAQMLVTEGKTNEAGWILKHVESQLEPLEEDREVLDLKVYYLYLTTLVDRDPIYLESVTERVLRAYRHTPGDWKIAWLLLFLSDEYQNDMTKRWEFLEEQFLNGCRSFAIYMEALFFLNQNPSALRKLGDFEIQVLNYGMKKGVLVKDLADQVIYLVSKAPKYQPVLYRILVQFMREKKDPRILQIICTMLIGEGMHGPKYLRWYAMAIQEKCRITNLYEYYLMSVPFDSKEPIPKAVLLYFSYQNNLGPDHSAFLYRYIVEHNKELSDIYETYYVKIQQFVIAQLLKHRISRDLAFLYEQFIKEDVITKELLPALSEIAYANEITVGDSRVNKIVIMQPGMKESVQYGINNRKAIISLYGEDCSIAFEDGNQNRFLDSVEYSRKQLMLPTRYQTMLNEYSGSIHMDVSIYLSDRQGSLTGEVQAARAGRIFYHEKVEKNLRIQAGLKLLQYEYDNDHLEKVDDILNHIQTFRLENEERAEVLKFLVLRGRYGDAYHMLELYGPGFGDTSTMLRLLGGLIADDAMAGNEVILSACACVLEKGKYNGAVLNFLSKYYNGPVKKLRDIYRADREFGTDAYELAERILIQLIATGSYLAEKNEIFHYYVSRGASEKVELAYLAQSAYGYFAKERIEDGVIFEEINNLFRRGENVPQICRIAFLKYCSELPQEDRQPYMPCMESWLQELLKDRIRMNFYRDLSLPQAKEELADKTIIEYRTEPGVKTKIHYMIVDDSGEDGDYRSEYMREIFPGVYTKEFVLFFGETLQYYIMEEIGDDATLTESATIQKSDISMESNGSRYDLINDMLISKSLQDYDTLDQAIEDYMIKDFFNENLFRAK